MEKTVLVQCLQKRKGGSIHVFGHHAAKQDKYHFKPVDPTDEDSPHVCSMALSNPHLQDMLAVKEGFRIYSEDSPVLSVPQVQTQTDADKHKNRYEDLLSVDAETVDNIWLEGFATEVLGVSPKSSQDLKAYYSDNYGLTLAGKQPNMAYIRAILKSKIAEEQAGSKLAEQIGVKPEAAADGNVGAGDKV